MVALDRLLLVLGEEEVDLGCSVCFLFCFFVTRFHCPVLSGLAACVFDDGWLVLDFSVCVSLAIPVRGRPACGWGNTFDFGPISFGERP